MSPVLLLLLLLLFVSFYPQLIKVYEVFQPCFHASFVTWLVKCPTGSGKNWKLRGLHVLLFWCHFINCLQSCKTFYSPPSFSCIVSTRFFLLFEVSLILLDQLLAFGTNFPREYKCCQTIQCKFWEKYIKKKCNILFSSIVALTCVFTQDAVTQRIAQQLITARLSAWELGWLRADTL